MRLYLFFFVCIFFALASGEKCETGMDCPGPNVHAGCGGPCDTLCDDLLFKNPFCHIRNIKCNNMCYCDEGYARNEKNICIPISECPAVKNGTVCPLANEVYTPCKKECPSDRCSSVLERCEPSDTCGPGCVCAPGYLRIDEGKPCIPQCQCPELANTMECLRCPLPNEEYTTCKKECPSDKCSSVNVRCIPSEDCSPGCVCSTGYLRKKDREPCIPMCQCPQLKNTSECKKNVPF